MRKIDKFENINEENFKRVVGVKRSVKIYQELDVFIEIFKESLADLRTNSNYKIVLKNHLKIL